MIYKSTLLLGLLATLVSCETSPPQSAAGSVTAEQVSASAATPEAARAAVRRHLAQQPDSALYVVDSALVNDVDTQWQILVPRTDWRNRMPNKAAFEVDKQTGAVSTRPVK